MIKSDKFKKPSPENKSPKSSEKKAKYEKEIISKKKINLKSIISEEKENFLIKTKIQMDEKLCQMEDNRISLQKIMKKFDRENSEQNQNFLFESINEFLTNQNLFSDLFEEIYKFLVKDRTKLKNKITSIFMSMDDKIDFLKKEKKNLQNKLGIPTDRRSENLKKLNQRLKKKIENYKKIVGMKEKVIKKFILKRTIKKNFSQLQKLKNHNNSMQNQILIQFLDNNQKNQKNKLQKMKNILFPKNIPSLQNLQNSENLKNPEKPKDLLQTFGNLINPNNPSENNQNQETPENVIKKLTQIFSSKTPSLQSLENSNPSIALNPEKPSKNLIYKQQVIKNAILIKNTKKEMREYKEKMQELNDAILSNELDLKMYERNGINNVNFLEKQVKIIELKKNKINYLKDELVEYREKIENLEVIIETIYKEVGGIHSENSQKIKCYNYVVRNYLNGLKKQNFKLGQFVSKIREKYNLKKFKDLKTEKLILQYQNLQLINNTLKKRFLGIKKKNIVVVLKKKKVVEEKELPKVEDMENILKKTEEQKNAVNCFLENKDDNLEEMARLTKQLEDLKNEIKKQMEEKNRIYESVLKQKNEIFDMKIQMENSKKEIKKMELDIFEKNQNEIKNKKDIENLQNKIANSKKSIKNIKTQKKTLKKEIDKKEKEIKNLNEKISKLLKKMEEVSNKNKKIKAAFENQFESLQKIFEGNFEQYSLLENLLKKEKIYSNLLKDQKQELKDKDKKIKKLLTKINKIEIKLKNQLKKDPIKKKTDKNFLKRYDMENEESLETKLENSMKNYNLLEKKYNNFLKKNKHFEDKEKIKMKDQIDFLRRTVRDYENIIKTLRNQSDTFETKIIIEKKKEIDLEDFLENLNNMSGIENFEEKGEINFNMNEPIFNDNKNLNFLSINSNNKKNKKNKKNDFVFLKVKKNLLKFEKLFQINFEKLSLKCGNLIKKFNNLKNIVGENNLKKNENSLEIGNINKLAFLENILDLFIKNNCTISKDDYIEITFEKINQYLFKTKNYENENLKNKTKIKELKEKVVLYATKIREVEDNFNNLKSKNEIIEIDYKRLKDEKSKVCSFEIKEKINILEKKNMELKETINSKSTLIMDLQQKVMEKKNNKNIIKKNSNAKVDFSFKSKTKAIKNHEFSFKNPNPKSSFKKKFKNIVKKIIPKKSKKKLKDYISPYSIKKIKNSRNSSKKNIFTNTKKIEEKSNSNSSSLGSDFNGSELQRKKEETFKFDEDSNISEKKAKNFDLLENSEKKVNLSQKNETIKEEFSNSEEDSDSEKIFQKKKIFNQISENNDSSNTLGSIDNDSEIRPKTDNFNFDESSAFNSKNFSDLKEEKNLKKKKNKESLEIIESVKESESENFLESLDMSKKLSVEKLNGIKNLKKKRKKKKVLKGFTKVLD